MKIEIIIGSGIGLFAESSGGTTANGKIQNSSTSSARASTPDARWQAILPSKQSPIKNPPSLRVAKAGGWSR